MSVIDFPIVVFSCVVPVVITVINCITSYKLRKSAREIPGEEITKNQANPRYRSARVVHFLCFVYWISHFPYLLAIMYEDYYYDHEFAIKYVVWTVNSLLFLNAVFYPLTLIKMSKMYRNLYVKYISDTLKIFRK